MNATHVGIYHRVGGRAGNETHHVSFRFGQAGEFNPTHPDCLGKGQTRLIHVEAIPQEYVDEIRTWLETNPALEEVFPPTHRLMGRMTIDAKGKNAVTREVYPKRGLSGTKRYADVPGYGAHLESVCLNYLAQVHGLEQIRSTDHPQRGRRKVLDRIGLQYDTDYPISYWAEKMERYFQERLAQYREKKRKRREGL
ncbi:hypothetical protein HY572_05445 [Candidatus Micrarchaeota archaeon]|nr:hypothetical protein [Candidatus Micrarchaeota archaeon]